MDSEVMIFGKKPLTKKKAKDTSSIDGKKRKIKKFKGAGLKIVDNDALSSTYTPSASTTKKSKRPMLQTFSPTHCDLDEDPDERPQIAAVIDERPEEIQALERFRSQSKWKTVGGPINSDSFAAVVGTSSFSDSNSRITSRRRADDDSDLDLSPVRRRRDSDSDLSPPRRKRNQDSDLDLSPVRRKKRRVYDSDSDLSPPRRKSSSSHSSNRTQSRRHKDRANSSDSDIDVPRPRTKSPSRRDKSDFKKRRPVQPEILDSPPRNSGKNQSVTLEGKKAGLQTAKALREEMIEFRNRENEVFAKLDDSVSGRTAKTKVRDRATGKERDFEAEYQKKREEDEKAQKRKEKYDKWGQGLKQAEKREEQLNDALHEISKPLARYKDDEDLDELLRNQDRDGDPMLQMLNKKKGKNLPNKLRYNGPAPAPNRFNIPPGYRWDGVDRSNGYEKKWFENLNTKKAMESEAYKWSIEDM